MVYMEVFDHEKGARVWQRVRGVEVPEEPGLRQLIGEEWADAVTLLGLSRRLRGQQGKKLQQLAHREQLHASRLKGICAQAEGCRPAVSAKPLPLERTESILRCCCDRQRRRAAIYEARSADPAFGHIYSCLAAQEREQWTQLLALLGDRL